jgi:hypothetical protein
MDIEKLRQIGENYALARSSQVPKSGSELYLDGGSKPLD